MTSAIPQCVDATASASRAGSGGRGPQGSLGARAGPPAGHGCIDGVQVRWAGRATTPKKAGRVREGANLLVSRVPDQLGPFHHVAMLGRTGPAAVSLGATLAGRAACVSSQHERGHIPSHPLASRLSRWLYDERVLQPARALLQGFLPARLTSPVGGRPGAHRASRSRCFRVDRPGPAPGHGRARGPEHPRPARL